jgi:hypothetical protein
MNNELRNTYYTLLIPATIGFAVTGLLKTFKAFTVGPVRYIEFFAPAVFILSVVLAVALPVFFRTIFANKMRNEKSVSLTDFIKFEKSLLYVSLITPYVTLIAFLFDFPRFHVAGSFLMTIYAVYYYYPSKKRIKFEKRIFRVQ